MAQARNITLFLTPGFPADEEDCACLPAVQSYVAAYARAHADHDVHVIAFQYPYARREYRWRGCTVHAIGGRNRHGIYRIRTWTSAVREAVRLRPVDRLHSFWLGECAYIGQWLRRWTKGAHVASIGGQDARSDNRYLSRLPLQNMTITAGSVFAANVFDKSTGHAVDAVIPIGLDPDFVRFAAPGGGRDIHLLGVGSLISLKRYSAFLDVAKELLRHHPDLRAVIIGGGPERERLQRRIDDIGLRKHVRLAGQKTREEVRRYMVRSRVLLHPSEYEAQGYVFLEALASGLFVVSRNVGFAGDHPAAYRCTSDEHMIACVRDVLGLDGPPAGPVLSVEETVDHFEGLWRRQAE